MAGKTNTAMYPIERLQVQLQVPEAAHTGACIKMGWSRGQQVTKADYAAAVESFRVAVAGRSKDA